MKTNDIIRAYTKGKLTAQEANGKLKEIGVNVRLVEGKNQLTAEEIAETHVGATPKEANGWGLLDTGTGAFFEKVHVVDGVTVDYPFTSNSAASRYVDYVKNGLDPETAGGLAKAMEELEPEAGRETVSDLQRYRTVVDYGLSRKNQLTVLKGMMDDSEYETMLEVCQKGLTPEQFVTFRDGTSRLSADKDRAGKTISGSKKRKVMAYIDSMNLSNAQKTALYYAAGYKASTLDEAPWYGRSESRWDIVPRLDG